MLGFDAFLNIVLGDATDYATTEQGTVATRTGDVLLNGRLCDRIVVRVLSGESLLRQYLCACRASVDTSLELR